MIQRIQSVYLLLAALLCAGVFYFDLYVYHTTVAGADVVNHLNVIQDFASLLIALVITILPLVTIFLFRNRKRQVSLSLLGILCIIGFMALSLWRVSMVGKLVPAPTSGNYWIGSVLPVIALVLEFMAISGIRKDDKLVKSVDRLR